MTLGRNEKSIKLFSRIRFEYYFLSLHTHTYIYINASYYTGLQQRVKALYIDNPIEKSIIRSVNNHVVENRSAERACITSRPVMWLTTSGFSISQRGRGAWKENKNTIMRVVYISHKQRMFINKKKNDIITHMEMTRNRRKQILSFFYYARSYNYRVDSNTTVTMHVDFPSCFPKRSDI